MIGALLFWGWVALAFVAVTLAILGAIVISVGQALELDAARERELDGAA